MQFHPQGTQSILWRCLLVQFEQPRYYTMSQKKMPIPQTSGPSISITWQRKSSKTGQYLSTNATTGENASVYLLRHQCTRTNEKKYQKPNKGKCSQFNQQQQYPPNMKSCPQWNDNDENENKDHKDRKKFKSDDCI